MDNALGRRIVQRGRAQAGSCSGVGKGIGSAVHAGDGERAVEAVGGAPAMVTDCPATKLFNEAVVLSYRAGFAGATDIEGLRIGIGKMTHCTSTPDVVYSSMYMLLPMEALAACVRMERSRSMA